MNMKAATGEALQFLQEHLKWPAELISAYGRVPVQIGSQTVWGDFVCYISKALRDLAVVDIFVKNDTANGYVYINEICRKLYEDKLEQRLKAEGYSFGLAAVHNLLWHYHAFCRTERKWFP